MTDQIEEVAILKRKLQEANGMVAKQKEKIKQYRDQIEEHEARTKRSDELFSAYRNMIGYAVEEGYKEFLTQYVQHDDNRDNFMSFEDFKKIGITHAQLDVLLESYQSLVEQKERDMVGVLNAISRAGQIQEALKTDGVQNRLSVGIEDGLEGYSTWFKIGPQKFNLQPVDSQEQARWYQQRLMVAFGMIKENQQPEKDKGQ